MAVIQGTTLDEWINELYFWLANPDVSLIGIPYDINFEVPDEKKMSTKARQWAYRRTYLLQQACTLRMNSWGDKRIHLLGMNDLCEFQMMRASVDPIVLSLIRSNDTTAPYAAAAADRMFMMENDVLTSGEKDWPSLDFHNEDIDTSTLVWNLCLYYWAALPDQQDNWPPAVRTMLETLLAFGFGE
jgi:hypothetical protein